MSGELKIGLIGLGNIGTGVVKYLDQLQALQSERLPRPLLLSRIVDKDTTTKREAPLDASILSDDLDALYTDPEIDVVIELVGGEEPARSFIERALKAGKHVITANKAVMAVYGPELLALADEQGVGLLFEASVGGGIPIIRVLQQGLCANALTSVQGILNGTCNYILTRMGDEGLSFDAVLADAKNLGYAEPDPTYDIEGYDTAHKTAILASLAFGMDIRFKDVHVEGITQVQPVDIRHARELGYVIKLLGIARRDDAGEPAEVRVHPTLVPSTSPLGQVSGVYNSVFVDGIPIGPTMYYGQGAGPDATSSAIISDLMALASDSEDFNRWRDSKLRIEVGRKQIKPMESLQTHYYLRFTMQDQSGVMASIGQALADQHVSIESMIQHAPAGVSDESAIITIVTHQAREMDIQSAIEKVEQLPASRARAFVLRVEE
jgi:homoserine dehydrogenase